MKKHILYIFVHFCTVCTFGKNLVAMYKNGVGPPPPLMPHFAFYNETRNDTFLVVNYRLPVNRNFFIWGIREPEFNDDHRRGSGSANI